MGENARGKPCAAVGEGAMGAMKVGDGTEEEGGGEAAGRGEAGPAGGDEEGKLAGARTG